MEIIPTIIKDLYIISAFLYLDKRGSFVKIFNKDLFVSKGLQGVFEEVFYSASPKNVLRGFHMQLPPKACEKIVWVTHGRILDVSLDLRKNSSTYGKHFSIELTGDNHKAVYLPKGVAHAFYVLSDTATVIYQASKCFSPEQDGGIKWNSIGFNWPTKSPIISEKDNNLPLLADFISPF